MLRLVKALDMSTAEIVWSPASQFVSEFYEMQLAQP